MIFFHKLVSKIFRDPACPFCHQITVPLVYKIYKKRHHITIFERLFRLCLMGGNGSVEDWNCLSCNFSVRFLIKENKRVAIEHIYPRTINKRNYILHNLFSQDKTLVIDSEFYRIVVNVDYNLSVNPSNATSKISTLLYLL
jgi:hypothetical protein